MRPPELLNEGFTQNEPFIVKLEEDAMDDFYVELYDTLHGVDKRSNLELSHIIKTTNPDSKNSVFLDVGSRTGKYIYELNEAGYQAYGMKKMITWRIIRKSYIRILKYYLQMYWNLLHLKNLHSHMYYVHILQFIIFKIKRYSLEIVIFG